MELFGDYVLLERIGAGSMGDISLACPRSADQDSPPLVVIKRLHAGLAQSEQMVRRFVHEARIAAALEDPHVMRVYEAGQVGATLYFVGELIAGASLAELITAARARSARFPVGVAAAWARDAARGLHALHSAVDLDGQPLEAVHRDVSPRNLMVDEHGRGRVIDLGLLSSRAQDWQTRTGAVMGSPGYMSPEQVGGLAVGAPADVYALGTVLFELLAGERYVPAGPTIVETVRASLTPTPRAAGRGRGDVPAALEQVLAQALALSPAARPSARALAEALTPFAADAATCAAHAVGLYGPAQHARLDGYRYLAGGASTPPIDEPTPAPTVVFARHMPRPAVSPPAPAPAPSRTTSDAPSGTAGASARRAAWLTAGAGLVLVASLAWSLSILSSPTEPQVIEPEPRPEELVAAPEPRREPTPAAVGVVPAAPQASPATTAPAPSPAAASVTVAGAVGEPPAPIAPREATATPEPRLPPEAPPTPRAGASTGREPTRRTPPATTSASGAPEDPVDPQAVRARVRQLRQRGLSLEPRLTPGSPEATELASILGRLALEAARSDPRQAARATDELEAAIRRLESTTAVP